MTKRDFHQHLDPKIGPKRILSLDGGGLRGALSLAFLKRIEDLLREQHGSNSDFRLSDYYDLIGGTSTGAIIASGLALGMSVKQVRDHYFDLGKDVFFKSLSRAEMFGGGKLSQRYDANTLAEALHQVFGERTLGSSDFKTGLIIVTKRLDTGSVWTLSNNPRGRYFNAQPGGDVIPNKDFRLWSVIRASTAAPTYFSPEPMVIKAANKDACLHEVKGEFVDGGVSPANNPTLQMVLAATTAGYGFDWLMGEDALQVTSVGTGRISQALGLSSGVGALAGPHALKALKSVLDDCQDLVEVVMQWLSESPTARVIDREIGTLSGSYPGTMPSLRYHRFNVNFEPQWFREYLDIDWHSDLLNEYTALDNFDRMVGLEKIGEQAASKFVRPEYFIHV